MNHCPGNLHDTVMTHCSLTVMCVYVDGLNVNAIFKMYLLSYTLNEFNIIARWFCINR